MPTTETTSKPQTVVDRAGNIIDVTQAEVWVLKDVVENRRDCGGGTHRERRCARRELRKRGYAWYLIFGTLQGESFDQPDENIGPETWLLSSVDLAPYSSVIWSQACVSPSEAWDRWYRKCP